MEEIIDTESYQRKKDELLKVKKELQEKITEIKIKGSSWLEPMKEFIKEAADAAKIARAKNNCKDLAIFAKKVGSNYFLKDKRLEFSLSEASAALAARAGAASAYPSDLLLCRREDSNLQSSQNTVLNRARLPFRHCGVFKTV